MDCKRPTRYNSKICFVLFSPVFRPASPPTLNLLPLSPSLSTNEDGGVSSKLDIRGAAGAASPSALHACLSIEHPSSTVLLATGSPASPGFTEALFQDSSGALLSSSSVGGGDAAAASEAQDEPGEEAAGIKGALAHVVGPGELGVRGAETDAVSASEGVVDEDGRALKKLKAMPGEGAGEEASVSIAERLEALSEAVDKEASRKARGARGGVLALAGADGAAVQPRAESLSTVLTQALQSGDESLLAQCLAVGDQGIIEATVERLPSSKVLQFLLRCACREGGSLSWLYAGRQRVKC